MAEEIFVQVSNQNGRSAYEIAVERGVFIGTEAEYAVWANQQAISAQASAQESAQQAIVATEQASIATANEANAAASALSASTSATQASTSEANALQYKNSAETAATTATAAKDTAVSVEQFVNTTYLGSSSADPTVDNNGDPLVTGAFYFNTVQNTPKIYNGTVWNTAAFDATGTVLTFNDRSGVVALTNDDVTNAVGVDLSSVEYGATADQTAEEIRALVEAATDSNVFTDADHNKLDGIEAGAQVNVGTNLGSSGTGSTRTITSSTGSDASITYSAADVGAPTTTGGGASGTWGINVTGNAGTVTNGVYTTGDQTLAGVKTFSSNPISSAAQSTATNALTRRDFVIGLDSANVKLTGNQAITGTKTFNGDIVVGSKLNDIGAAYLSRVSQERAVMAASGGNMRLIWDNADKPSYMYRVPLGMNADVGLPGAGIHPAFIVNGTTIREFWVGAFPASLDGGKAYSIPGVDPAASIDFDNSFNACTSKGAGWHMMSNAEWGYIQAWCMANGYQPRGNTNWGRAFNRVLETGTRPEAINPGVASGHGRTLTGSGPHTWRHNGMEFGIADLVGNVWEWCSGMRLVDGEIQIIPNNDAAAGVDNTVSSTLWRAVLADGSLVAPGTANTIKYTSASGTVYNNVVATASNDLLKQLGLLPNAGGHVGTFYVNQTGERLPLRGGSRSTAAGAGLSALYLFSARSRVISDLGFRPAFVDL